MQPGLDDHNSLNDDSSYHGSISAMHPGQGSQPVDSPDPSQARDWHSDVTTAAMKNWQGNVSYDQQRESFPLDPQFANSNDERLGVDFLLDNNQRQLQLQNGMSATQGTNLPDKAHRAPWEILPQFLQATCPLDTLLGDFLNDRRRRRADGADNNALVGPKYPNFDPLIEPSREHHSHELSKVFTDILRTFPDISRLPDQVAVVYIMFLVMRWLVAPTRENYELMPEWVQPRASQLFTPYPHWCSYLPW